jgi:hypothetical protein
VSLRYATQRLDVRPWTDAPSDVDRVFAIYSRWYGVEVEAFRLTTPDRGE